MTADANSMVQVTGGSTVHAAQLDLRFDRCRPKPRFQHPVRGRRSPRRPRSRTTSRPRCGRSLPGPPTRGRRRPTWRTPAGRASARRWWTLPAPSATLANALQRAHRLVVVAGARWLDVALHDRAPGADAGVGHRHGDAPAAVGAAGHGRRAELERRVPQAVAEREPRLDVARVVPAVADQPALGVDRLAVAAGMVVERRRVLQAARASSSAAARPAPSSPSSTSATASPSSSPGNQTCITAATSSSHGIAHRRPGVDHHDRARVRRGDPADQLVLLAGQAHRRAVLALGLPVAVRPDDDDGHLGGAPLRPPPGRCRRRRPVRPRRR